MYKTKKAAPPVPPRPSIGKKSTTPKSHQDEINNNNRLMPLECKNTPVGRTVIYKSTSSTSASTTSSRIENDSNSKFYQNNIFNLKKSNNQQNNDITPIMKKENTRNYYNNYENDSPSSNISLISSSSSPLSSSRSSKLHTSAGCYSQSVLTQNNNFINNKYNSILQLPENHGISNNKTKAYELKRNKTEIIIKLANSSGVINKANMINDIQNIDRSNTPESNIKSQNFKTSNINANVNRIKISNNNNNSYDQQIKPATPLFRSKSTLCSNLPRKRSSIIFIEDNDNMQKSAERLFSEISVNQNKYSTTENKNIYGPIKNLSKRPEPEGGCETSEKTTEQIEAINNQSNKFKFNRGLTFHEILISEISENREKKSKEVSIKQSFSSSNINPIKNDRSAKEIEKLSKSKTENNFTQISNKLNTFNDGKKVISECQINIDDSGLEDEAERSLDDCSGNINFSGARNKKKIDHIISIPALPKSLCNIDKDNNFYVEKLKNSIQTLNQTSPITNSKLDSQLEILRKEMLDLRQLDISLLMQLRTLNDSIQEFRTMLQEQDQLNEESESSSSDESLSSCENEKEFSVIPSTPQKLIVKKPIKPIRADSFQQKRAYKSRPAPQPPIISNKPSQI